MEHAKTAAVFSPPIRFLLSVLGLAIVAGAVLVNFGLLAGAQSVMTGGGRNIGALTVAEISTLLIIVVELGMGLFLTEARGITSLLPDQMLPKVLRPRIFWIALCILVLLALNGAGVIYLEDLLSAKGTAIGTGGSAVFLPVPLWLRMGLAFCLPIAIALWAVPFEALLRTFRAPRI